LSIRKRPSGATSSLRPPMSLTGERIAVVPVVGQPLPPAGPVGLLYEALIGLVAGG
jgi:hypothetical protein